MIHRNITELIGRTPLVEISGVEGQKARIAVKVEASLNQARLGLMNEKYNYISAVLDLETKLNIKLQNKK